MVIIALVSVTSMSTKSDYKSNHKECKNFLNQPYWKYYLIFFFLAASCRSRIRLNASCLGRKECMVHQNPEYLNICGCEEDVCSTEEYENCYTCSDELISCHTNISDKLVIHLQSFGKPLFCYEKYNYIYHNIWPH